MTDTIPDHLTTVPLPIVTPRLVITIATPDDAEDIHAAVLETLDDLRRWMPWAKDEPTLARQRDGLRRTYADFILRRDFRMIARSRADNSAVVFTGLHRFDWEIRRMEIGYWTRKSAQGNGLAAESATALAHFAFSALGARTVAICHADGNEPSRKVIERIGFEYEGRERNAGILPDGRICDKLWYSLVDPGKVPALDVRWGMAP